MNQQLPPPELVATWLDIIQNQDMSLDIINKRTKLLCYYFGSFELASEYVELNQFTQRIA